MFTENDKSSATILKSRCSRTAVNYRLMAGQALPLVWTRFLWLAKNSPKIARSPTRRSRDGRATSGKKSGEISRAMPAQRPGNGRAMPPSVRQDGSQDNLPCVGNGHEMSAPETGETTRNMFAQQPCHSPCNGHASILRDNLPKSHRQP
jgi:hypothetical protein